MIIFIDSVHIAGHKKLSFLSWWEDQVSIAAKVVKEWSIYLKGIDTYRDPGFSPQKTKEPSIFLSLFIRPWYFYDPHNLPERKSECLLFPIEIFLFPGTKLFHFSSCLSYVFHNCRSYSSDYAINFIVLFAVTSQKSPFISCSYRLHWHVPVPKCSDFVAGYVISDIIKWNISQIVILMFRFKAKKYKIWSLQPFSVSCV